MIHSSDHPKGEPLLQQDRRWQWGILAVRADLLMTRRPEGYLVNVIRDYRERERDILKAWRDEYD